jgi:hypothetical protein
MRVVEFIDYVLGFYGSGGVYDMGATRDDVAVAVGMRMARAKHSQVPFEGDSLDREAVRSILIRELACWG